MAPGRAPGGAGGAAARGAGGARRPAPSEPQLDPNTESDATDLEPAYQPSTRRGAGAAPVAAPAAAAAAAPMEDKLPLLLGRLNKPDADWDKWGINELTRWCRESIRSRPHQSSIAILLLSYENGALLDLVSESYNGTERQSDAALRLRKGRVDIGCA